MGNLPPLDVRMEELLERVAEESRPCRACGVKLYFVRHKNGKIAPYTVDGVNHFVNCPKAAQFKRRVNAQS